MQLEELFLIFIQSTLYTELATCPCCGYPTLPERGAWNMCYLCFWEDDGQDDADADIILGGPTGNLSLSMARLNFDKYNFMYDDK